MRLVAAILIGGLIAGMLDILYAFVVYGPLSYGLSPIGVLHSVAAGWIGRDEARAGGLETAALGFITHFGIALAMAAAYVLASRLWPALTRRAVLWGLVYGGMLYVTMNYVVTPLSAASAAGDFAADGQEVVARLADAFSTVRPRFDPAFPWMIPGTLFAHMVLVGLPIALAAQRLTPPRIEVAS